MEDWEFDAQAGAAGITLHYCDEWLAEYVIHDGDRLAHAWRRDDHAFADMVEAQLTLLAHAESAGVPPRSAQTCRYAATLFRAARMCAARGMMPLAGKCLDGAARAAVPRSKTAWQIKVFRAACAIFGWRTIGQACAARAN
jgi:hypothetical protein